MMRIRNPNMKKIINTQVAGLICLLIISSCCNKKDQVYWFPEEAIRYYNDHDTLKFYCPESDVIESYIVCRRDTSIDIEQYYYNQFCEYAEFRHILSYKLSLDSCSSSSFILVSVNTVKPEYIQVSVRGFGSYDVGFGAVYDESKKFSIDVLDHTYSSVIEIPDSESSEIPFILFSYEYGIIQIQYENQTFNLINDEN
jgi:hypothetical protein